MASLKSCLQRKLLDASLPSLFLSPDHETTGPLTLAPTTDTLCCHGHKANQSWVETSKTVSQKKPLLFISQLFQLFAIVSEC